MTTRIFLQVRPLVHGYLNAWAEKARAIPDPELRRQALMSIRSKTFHCEGGAIYGLLAGNRHPEAIRFIVAYQTISDYLDNLCDRSTSLDPEDFALLHQAMLHALTPSANPIAYYRLHPEQDDGGYLLALVTTCQESLRILDAYPLIAETLHALADDYCMLQVHKHVREEDRVPRLEAWFSGRQIDLPDLSWYEFAAATGSTLGIFCLVSYAHSGVLSTSAMDRIRNAYFPWVQGLHILLDYFIDQQEDRLGGDLNFCSYYPSEDLLAEHLAFFYNRSAELITGLPDHHFHLMINKGLLGMYLADRKVAEQGEIRRLARKMIGLGGGVAWFFFIHCWIYRRLRKPS